jgi:hypothetical protein
MKLGTKSVLFGAHCFLLHPWFVAAGWWKLYSQRAWHRDMQAYVRRWVEAHRDGRDDAWAPDTRRARTETGGWQ